MMTDVELHAAIVGGDWDAIYRGLAALRARAEAAEAALAEAQALLRELREEYDHPEMANCPNPKGCPWSDKHERIARIDAALGGAK